MNLILDTHVLIWYLTANPKLSNTTKDLIEDFGNSCFVIIVSLWEIAIKHSLGKLELKTNFNDFLEMIKHAGIETLYMNELHVLKAALLDFHHHDPFDRMILAQAMVEDFTIITKDQSFKDYTLNLIKI